MVNKKRNIKYNKKIIKNIPYGKHFINKDDINEVANSLKNKNITQGPLINKFEERLKVINSKIIMDNHIKTLLIGRDGTKIKAISFNAKNTLLEPYLLTSNKKKLNIVGKMSLNEWQGKREIEFVVDDISIN